jgi:hypothetical protein
LDRLDWPDDDGSGLDAVAVPGAGPDEPGPVRGRVYVVALLHDRPETRALLGSILDPSAARVLDPLLTGGGLWRPGATSGPSPDRDLVAAALARDTFRVRLEDTVPAPVATAMAEGLATYAWSGDTALPLFAGGIRQAWARLPLDDSD